MTDKRCRFFGAWGWFLFQGTEGAPLTGRIAGAEEGELEPGI
jgi:hypothetical protein